MLLLFFWNTKETDGLNQFFSNFFGLFRHLPPSPQQKSWKITFEMYWPNNVIFNNESKSLNMK